MILSKSFTPTKGQLTSRDIFVQMKQDRKKKEIIAKFKRKEAKQKRRQSSSLDRLNKGDRVKERKLMSETMIVSSFKESKLSNHSKQTIEDMNEEYWVCPSNRNVSNKFNVKTKKSSLDFRKRKKKPANYDKEIKKNKQVKKIVSSLKNGFKVKDILETMNKMHMKKKIEEEQPLSYDKLNGKDFLQDLGKGEEKAIAVVKKQKQITGSRRFIKMNSLGLYKDHSKVIKKLSTRFEVRDIVGKGSFSFIYLAYNIKKSFPIALKIGKSKEEEIKHEYDLLKKLNHPNIIKVFDFIKEPSSGFSIIAMEYAGAKTLKEIQQDLGDSLFQEETAILYIFKLIKTIMYLHNQRVAHGDIKLENVMIDSEGNLKLIDFGFSAIHHKKANKMYCGTVHYMSPELLAKNPYWPFKADVWALGVLIYRLIYKTYPFKGKNQAEVLSKIRIGVIEFDDQIKSNFKMKKLIRSILIADEEKRPNIYKVSIIFTDIFKHIIKDVE